MKKIITLSLLFLCINNYFSQNSKINQLADLYINQAFKTHPEYGTMYGIENADNVSLGDNSMNAIRLEEKFEDSLFAELIKIDKKSLTKVDLLTYEVLFETLESDKECRICKDDLWLISHLDGWHIGISALCEAQPIGSELNRKNTLKRWMKIPVFIQNEMDKLKVGLKQGYSTPKVIVELIITQLDEQLAIPVKESPFYIRATKNTLKDFGLELEKIISNQIYPKIKEYRDFLQFEYLPKAKSNIGISSNPNGPKCYEAKLRANTTLKISANQMFENGLKSLNFRKEKIIKIGTKIFKTSNFESIKSIVSDTSETFKSKEELIQYTKNALNRAEKKLPLYFNLVTKQKYKIEPIPDYAPLAINEFQEPIHKDVDSGIFLIQLYDFKHQNKGLIEALAFHEVYPGHHLQGGIQLDLAHTSFLLERIGNGGFNEGWARYSEFLADEMKLYSNDTNRLNLYFRFPFGMIVDPGVHSKNWTINDAMKYYRDYAPNLSKKDIENYVLRIIVTPGQMTCYGTGESVFLDLRKKAEEKLGDKFDIKEFHDKCLENGSIPLNLLEKNIDTWLDQK